MAQNLELDPKKRDYVLVNGSPVSTNRVLEKTYFALTIPQGKWLYGLPNQGSLIYTLLGQKRSTNLEQQFDSYASEAIKSQVINTGDATASQIKNVEATRTGTSNEIKVVPSGTSLSDQLSFVPV